MKIVCSRNELASAINIVSKAVAVRSTISIMECILFSAENDEIHLTANNNEMGIDTIVNGRIEEEGIVALDAKIISDIVRKLPDDDITISVDDSLKTTIVCEKAKFAITGKSGDDFSFLPKVEMENGVEISQFALKEAIRQTIFSVADSDSNMIMTGELFEIKDDLLKIVSLDGHRISMRNITLNDAYGDRKVIVPGKTLQELNKILSGEQDEIAQLFFSENHLMFLFGETTVVTRLIEGNYFDVDKMISNDFETKVKVNKRDLLSCIDRATLLSKEGDKKPVVMSFHDNTMKISMKSFIGSMNEELDIAKEGKNLEIGFNPNFFIDALRAIDDEEVTLYLINQKYPCIIKDDKGTYLYLILPVNFINS